MARTAARKVVAIDDAPGRRHDCDLLVDATLGRSARDYADWLPSSARVLAGPTYALIRPDFAAARGPSLARRKIAGAPKRVVVSFGLSDLGGLSEIVVRSLSDAEGWAIVDVVIGPAAPSRSALEALSGRDPRIRVHVDPANLAELLAAADLAIGAPGSSSWERCCLGLPAILIPVAENQLPNARSLANAGAAVVLPDAKSSPDTIREAAMRMRAEPETLASMSARAAELCDGLGAQRVADAILKLSSEE
jgi:UDP-2,4-diacetamido-2,4,6-trideoxy-beta-L-altropyranose hydrolase